jgi:two-component system, OmpR family, phosphate regulon sensor histidine kinase PhoR
MTKTSSQLSRVWKIVDSLAVGIHNSIRWLVHPISVFVILQILWVAVVVIWVVWFAGISEDLRTIAMTIPWKWREHQENALIMLIIGCVLIGMLAVGTAVLFTFGQKQSALIRQQRTFLSSVTHELRSPLAALQLALETLKRPGISTSAFNTIIDNGTSDIERLRKLIDQILVSSRFDRGLLPFDSTSEKVNISEMITGTIHDVTRQTPQAVNRLEVDCSPDLEVTTIQPALVLILSNLLENALKYSNISTKVKIAATIFNEHLLITIKDQGIGLDRRERRKIFRMFHRSSRAVKLAVPGTGLGLFIANSAAKVLNGKIWAESKGVGAGSTFYISLPLMQAVQT